MEIKKLIVDIIAKRTYVTMKDNTVVGIQKLDVSLDANRVLSFIVTVKY